MKVLFIYSLEDTQSMTKPMRSWTSIQLGISYISSMLKAEGYYTELLILGSNNNWQNNVKLLNSFMERFSPDIICLGYDQKTFIDNLESKLVDFGLATKIVRLKSFHPEKYKSSKLKQ